MATKPKPPVVATEPDIDPAVAVVASDARQTMPPEPTPENTPVPGGGRWRWDIAAPGWVAVDDAA